MMGWLAQELGIDETTVRRARREAINAAPDSAVETRVGADGKTYHLPGTEPAPVGGCSREVKIF